MIFAAKYYIKSVHKVIITGTKAISPLISDIGPIMAYNAFRCKPSAYTIDYPFAKLRSL